MKTFRDYEGNFYRIPDEELQRYRVQGDLPEGSELSGHEVGGAGSGSEADYDYTGAPAHRYPPPYPGAPGHRYPPPYPGPPGHWYPPPYPGPPAHWYPPPYPGAPGHRYPPPHPGPAAHWYPGYTYGGREEPTAAPEDPEEG